MSAHMPRQLERRYRELRRLQRSGRLSPQQFLDEVERLQARDSAGHWWAIDATNGGLLRYDGIEWAPASPRQYATPGGARPGRPRLAIFAAVGMPLVTAAVWFLWAALHPVAERGIDCLTPLIMAGGPIALLLFQEPVDRVLMPLQPLRKQVPGPLRLGAAFALPVVLGLLLSATSYAGFGALRLTLILSMIGAHVLLREPEVRL
jgi:hypothetical protein